MGARSFRYQASSELLAFTPVGRAPGRPHNRHMKLTGLAAAAALGTVLILSACSASGGTASAGGSGSSGSGGTSTAAAKVSGDYTGTVAANNCASAGIMSITVTISGSKYVGSISSTQAGFVGPDAADFVTDTAKDPSLPTVSSDGNTFTLSSVHVYDRIGGKSMVLDGKLSCP